MSDNLHPKTQEILDEKSLEERKDMGQYFTPQPIIDSLLSNLPDRFFEDEQLDVLDPASGTGEFLLYAQDNFNDPNLEGWELDQNLAETSKEILDSSVTIRNVNTLFTESDSQYDLIIGNPPYYEIKLTDEIRKKYERVVYGRTNIYNLFIYKSLQMLKDGGYLAFVIPPSMNNGKYFKELRDYIVKNCSIEHLSVHEDSEIFEDASQSVMYFVVEKGGDDDSYVFNKGDITIFSEKADYLNEQFKDKKTLSELGYEVTTGRLVWNKNKEKLKEQPSEDTIPVIWSKNIVDGELKIDPSIHSKPQYITDQEPNIGPAVVVNRVVGQPGKGSIRAAYIEEGFEFIGENHVNVIQQNSDPNQMTLESADPELNFDEILEQLNSDDNVKIVQTITGNSQISKTELQELFPFKVNS